MPIGTMIPVSSAISMNSPGATRPRTGCAHRRSASSAHPVTRPEVELRLEQHTELVALERLAESPLGEQASRRPVCASPGRTARTAHRRGSSRGTSRRRRRAGGWRDDQRARRVIAIPMLAVTTTSACASAKGSLSAWIARSASSSTWCSSVRSSQTTTNSSPPNLATVSLRRTVARAGVRPRRATRHRCRGRTRR